MLKGHTARRQKERESPLDLAAGSSPAHHDDMRGPLCHGVTRAVPHPSNGSELVVWHSRPGCGANPSCMDGLRPRACKWAKRTSHVSVSIALSPNLRSGSLFSLDLLKQRKRWLNGALFALFYAFMHAHQFYTSGLSFLRKVCVTVEV